MTKLPTTIIVGAGASAECGLPTGSELKNYIAQILNIRFEHGLRQISGDTAICEALKHFSRITPENGDISVYLKSCRRISDAMPQAISIDNFIDVNHGDAHLEFCGKMAIVHSILNAEKRSLIYFDPHRGRPTIDFEVAQKTWLGSFFHWLTENCKASQLEKRFSVLSLIIFNYDRCVEHFLYHALQNYYGISASDSSELISKLTVFHPYGTAGVLPWQNAGGSVGFGAEINASQLFAVSNQIRTFTEGTDPAQSEIESIRQRFLEAKRVLFLGFAYHPMNLALLKSGVAPHCDNMSTKYFGTAFGISTSNCSEIQSELSELGCVPMSNIHIRKNLKCERLFNEYSRSL